MKLKVYLAEQGLTERQFSELIGTSQAAINRYCAGRIPKAGIMQRIVTVTGGRVTHADFYPPATQAAE